MTRPIASKMNTDDRGKTSLEGVTVTVARAFVVDVAFEYAYEIGAVPGEVTLIRRDAES